MDTERKQSRTPFRCPASISCSVCLESICDGGDRSLAKLKCGHHFHLDCIGSAFNAKGAMQCPNCRHIEHGQWLYGNGCRPYEEFLVEDFSNEDYLNDSYHAEMPFRLPWCPYRGPFSHYVLSHMETEPPLPASTSSGSRVCPYLALHGVSQMRQMPLPLSNAGTGYNMGDATHHQENTISTTDAFGSNEFPVNDIHNQEWRSSNIFNSAINIANTDDLALPVLQSRDAFEMPAAEVRHRHVPGSRMPSSHVPNRYQSHIINGRALPSSFIPPYHGHEAGSLYRSSPASMHNNLMSHGSWARSHDNLVTSRRPVQPVAVEQPRMQGSLSYPLNRSQEGENLGWYQRGQFYGLQREEFSQVPWYSPDQDSHHWVWVQHRQIHQNSVLTPPVSRRY